MKSKALRTKHNEWSTLCNTKATRWWFVATLNAQSVELSYAWFSQIGSHMHHLVHFVGYNMLTKFQFHCSITCRDILYFVF